MSESPDPLSPREAPSDPTALRLRSGGGDVNVVVDGDLGRPVVVCVHGIPGSVRDFRYVGPALARRGLCAVRVDLPGFGHSDRGAFEATASADLAAFVRGVLRSLGVKRFAVCGHSFGGSVALAAAGLFADDVTALVLFNSVGVHRHRGLTLPQELTGQGARLFDVPLLKDVLTPALARLYAANGLKSDTPLDAAAFRRHAELLGALDFAKQRAFARAVRAPVFLASADDDPLLQPSIATRLAASLPRAPLVTHRRLQTGGHALQKWSAAAAADWAAARLLPQPER